MVSDVSLNGFICIAQWFHMYRGFICIAQWFSYVSLICFICIAQLFHMYRSIVRYASQVSRTAAAAVASSTEAARESQQAFDEANATATVREDQAAVTSEMKPRCRRATAEIRTSYTLQEMQPACSQGTNEVHSPEDVTPCPPLGGLAAVIEQLYPVMSHLSTKRLTSPHNRPGRQGLQPLSIHVAWL